MESEDMKWVPKLFPGQEKIFNSSARLIMRTGYRGRFRSRPQTEVTPAPGIADATPASSDSGSPRT